MKRMEHPSHKLDSYKDDGRKWIIFCRVCGQEEENLSEPCPGEYVNRLKKVTRLEVDNFS